MAKEVNGVAPRSLRSLLEQIRINSFPIKKHMMAELHKVRRIEGVRHFEPSNKNLLTKLEKGEQSLNFEILETYARFLKMPVGILLLTSRYQKMDLKEARKSIEAFLEVLSIVEERDNNLLHSNQNVAELDLSEMGFNIDDLFLLSEKINLQIEPPILIDDVDSISQKREQSFYSTPLGESIQKHNSE